MTSLDPLERVVSTLARDPNLPRVKKLLYCACYGVWEDSAERLNRVSLREIVQGVWERSPTLEALQFQLNRVVKTLNKPVAYAHVANSVLQVLNDLYFDTYDITQPVMVNRVQLPLSIPGHHPPNSASAASAAASRSAANGHQPTANSGLPRPATEPGPGYYGEAGTAPQAYGYGGEEQYYPPNHSGSAPAPAHHSSPNQPIPSPYGAGSYGAPNPGAPQPHPGDYPPAAYGSARQAPAGRFSQPRYGQSAGYGQSGIAPAQAPPTEAVPTEAVPTEAVPTQWFVGGQQDNPSTLTPAQLSAQTAVRAHVLQSLAQHPEQRRMKKLLVCVCHNQWENNQSHLAAVDWELLLNDARQLMPTLQGLGQVLKAIVNSLSKPMEYQQVAHLLLDIVTPLYEQDRPEETQFFGVTPEPAARDGHQDPRQVDDFAQGRLSSLNHAGSNHAGPSQAGPTYSAAPAAPHFRAPSPPPAPQAAEGGAYRSHPARRASDGATHSPHLPIGNAAEVDDGPSTGLFAPQLPTSPMDQKYPPRALPSHGGVPGDAFREESTAAIAPLTDAATRPIAGLDPLPPPESQSVTQSYVATEAFQPDDAPELHRDELAVTPEEEAISDEFTLRLSLMRYANPLMCKVVIFSSLYRLFRFSEQDWVELRHHSLASLIEELEKRYPNMIDLEMKLCGVAEQLEVPEQAMQTAAALLKVLKPHYDRAQNSPARNMELAIATQSRASMAGPSSGTSRGVSPNVHPGAASASQTERATAIQFGPDGQPESPEFEELQADLDSSMPASAVIAEVLPSDEASSEALMSDDLEADLALLAASLEDDGPSLPQDS